MTSLATIYKLKSTLDTHRPFPKEVIRNLDEWYKVELTYTSNAIEGNTLTRQETAQVVEKGLTVAGKSITEHLEAINHATAWEYVVSRELGSKIDITEQTILEIHSLILNNIDNTNAGRYRNVPVRIAGSSVVLPNPLKVPTLMAEFIDWLQTTTDDIVDVAIQAHYKFVSIHPFADGNGRTGRLLMNLILMQAGFPPAIIRAEDRREYISSLEKGQMYGDLSDYLPFMYAAVERSLNISLDSLAPKDIVEDAPVKLLKIGELAKITHETVPTIRFWTQSGLLNVAAYSDGGYQLYHRDMIYRASLIRHLQEEKRLTIGELKKVIV